MPSLDYLPETPSQTAGPFIHIGLMSRIAGFDALPSEPGSAVAGPDVAGERIVIEGVVRDGMGAPCRDLVIELWQADASGIYAHPEDPRHAEVADGFTGFGRVHTDLETGVFRIETIKPGSVPGRHGGRQAPHLNLWLVARGINLGLNTRLYFEDEAEANAEDAVLNMIDPPHRRETLIARRDGEGAYRFDIRLQGGEETVFLDV